MIWGNTWQLSSYFAKRAWSGDSGRKHRLPDPGSGAKRRGRSDAGTHVVPVTRAGGKGPGAQRVQAGGPATSQRPPSLGRPPASLCCLLKLTDEAVDI